MFVYLCLPAYLLLSDLFDLTGCPVGFLQVLIVKEEISFTTCHMTKVIWPQAIHSAAPFEAFGPLSSTPMQYPRREILIVARGECSKAGYGSMRYGALEMGARYFF